MQSRSTFFLFNKKVGKRGISPLIATVLLVAFAVALGAVVMNWAKGVEETDTGKSSGAATSTAQATQPSSSGASTCLIPAPVPQDPLKQLMVKYLRGEITKMDYFTQSNGFK